MNPLVQLSLAPSPPAPPYVPPKPPTAPPLSDAPLPLWPPTAPMAMNCHQYVANVGCGWVHPSLCAETDLDDSAIWMDEPKATPSARSSLFLAATVTAVTCSAAFPTIGIMIVPMKMELTPQSTAAPTKQFM